MPALPLETLFNPEQAIEPLTAQILGKSGLQVFTSRSAEERTDRRVDFMLELGRVQGHLRTLNGGTLFDRWHAQFVFRVVTPRTEDGLPEKFHADMRAKVRASMIYARNAFTPLNLPNFQIYLLAEAGTVPSVENELMLDWSEIRFDSVIGISDAAWSRYVTQGM